MKGFVCIWFCVDVCGEDVRFEVLASHSNVSVNQLTTFNILLFDRVLLTQILQILQLLRSFFEQ